MEHRSSAGSDALQRGRLLAGGGRKAEAVAALVTAAQASADPRDAADLLVEAATLALWAYGPERALSLAAEAAELARGTAGAPEVRALTRLGDALLWSGRYDEARAAWEQAAAVPAPLDASVRCERANALMRAGEVASFREAAYEALVAARRTDSAVELLDALSLACLADIHAGLLREALLSAEQAVAASRAAADDPPALPYLDAIGLLAWVTALLGDVDRCRGALATAAEVTGALPMTAPGGLAQGMLALGMGEHDVAVRAFESKLRELAISPAAQACGPRPFVPSLVEAYARTGQGERARALVDELLPVALRTQQPRIVAPVLRARAVAYADLESFAEAAMWHARWGNLYEEGRTLLAHGELLRRRKQREQARRALRAAVERFEHVGAVTWTARAGSELRAAGERARVGARPGGTGRLTQQEAAVVDLVAAGLSNRELAEHLFLSVKTVEGHLTAIYDKLGVRSRTQLLAALASADPPSRP
jgi:DNA-binding CsgD family transcriptional regulator